VSSDPRHRPQSVLGFNIGAQVARQYRACRPGVFLAGDSARIIKPPTGGGLGGNNAAESRTPTTWPGSCGSGAPRPGRSRTRATRYTYHNERHPIGLLLTICSSRPLPGSAPARVKGPRCPTHRLWGGDDGLPVYRSSAVLGASEDISPLLPSRSYSGRAWDPCSARSGHLGGREISTIDLYGRRFVLLACRGQWRGVDLGCEARNAAAWRTARCIYRFGVELGGAEVAAAAAHCLGTDGALLVHQMASSPGARVCRPGGP
jgi:putative polyketide hydroxylase